MNPQTHQALLDSIEKWRKNETVNDLKEAKVDGSECPLCRVHYNCEGCPVYEIAGAYGCDETPYCEAFEAYHTGSVKAFREHAKRERIFLESLLPKE